MDSDQPDAIAGVDTGVRGAFTTTSQTAIPTLQNANCLSRLTSEIRAAGFVDGGVGFQSQALETPPSTLEYIGIIATNDFFVGVEGTANLLSKGRLRQVVRLSCCRIRRHLCRIGSERSPIRLRVIPLVEYSFDRDDFDDRDPRGLFDREEMRRERNLRDEIARERALMERDRLDDEMRRAAEEAAKLEQTKVEKLSTAAIVEAINNPLVTVTPEGKISSRRPRRTMRAPSGRDVIRRSGQFTMQGFDLPVKKTTQEEQETLQEPLHVPAPSQCRTTYKVGEAA